MNAPDRSAWLRKLGEASALPPDDERRQAVEAEVARRGGWAQAQWLSLLEEGERMRLELARVDAPDGLDERLLAIPADARPPRMPVSNRGRLIAVAALVFVAIGAAWMLWPANRSLDERLNEVGVMAVNDHCSTHHWDVTAESADELAARLRPHIPFEVNIPREVGELRVVGGRLCKLGGHPVAFSLWRGQEGPVTLLQIQRDDFDLPADLPPKRWRPRRGGERACEHEVLMFGRGEYVWVFVADDARDLEAVHEELASK